MSAPDTGADAATYVAAVLLLYVDLPDTPLRASVQDQRQARRLHDRGIPLPLVESALLLGSLRRLVRPADVPPLSPIRSLAYFQPVIEELLAHPVPENYLEYLRLKLRYMAGESPEDVIRTLGFTRSCIYTWLALYRAGGWGALRARALKGRPMKIQPQQMGWLYRTITGKSPLQYRFAFALWTREIVRMLLAEEFQLKLSLSSVGRLLKQLGLSCQRPLFRAIEQDPERVRQWLEEEYPRIRRQARQQGAEIYFGDEAGVRSDCHSGRTWGAKGRTPVVVSTGQRSSVRMISAVNARGRLRFMLTKGRVNGPVFVEFLKRLMHNAQRPIFLILDGGSFHHSRPVRDYVDSLGGKLRLFFLPPYSPELNPDEQVWNYVKHHGVAKAALRGRNDLKQFVLARLRSLQKLPWTVRMFFLTPDTQYAAL